MSNRIAASRMADRVTLVERMPPAARRTGSLAAMQGWLRQAMTTRDVATLSGRMRQDIGLAAVAPVALDFEARRLGF